MMTDSESFNLSESQRERLNRAIEAAEALPIDQRETHLRAELADDPELLEVAIRLLDHLDPTEAFLNVPHDLSDKTIGRMPEVMPPFDRIGPYRILQQIGEGGMGVVYLAEQTEPVRRRVALKIIKLGMDSKQVLARFEAERQALAVMDHQCVAKVFDAGVTNDGRSYFVMEYVSGVPITEHCDRQRLTIEQRLELFMRVCEAVQHAHQKGIIHRDIKPSNILIGASGDPKVIDFGVAKALHQKLTEITLFTEHGQLIGTPEYMSPEQAEMTAQDIDTRSDIYSLGVLLYELLTGALPFDPTTLRRAALGEIQRIIREEEPPRPSTRLSSLDNESATHARKRREDTRSLARELRGDLDWITMKALEKDRNRRYETANGLAEDIRRHLSHEPVLAGPPSAAYRTRKFIRRNRGQVIAAGVVFTTLLVGMAGTTFFMVRAQANLDKFDLLANAVKLSEARASEGDLYPAWPEKAGAIRTWITEEAEPIERELPELKQTLDELSAQALTPTAEERNKWRQSHPRFVELTTLRQKLVVLEWTQEVRAGQTSPEIFVLDSDISDDPREFAELAWPLVSWEESERQWGREAEGLALSRRAWELGEEGETNLQYRASLAHGLSWALFANGLDDEAISMMETAMDIALEKYFQRQRYQNDLVGLKDQIEAAKGASGTKARADLAAEIESLETEVSERQEWRFADKAVQFLHDTLTQLVDDVQAFIAPESGELSRVRERLGWAEKVRQISINAHEVIWEEARLAISKADGIVASELYADRPINLQPQLGLVPIGMNPESKLWEFYHLRSAADPHLIPAHDEEGNIKIAPETGIVFVLIPGGTFVLGAQSENPTQLNYDPNAAPNNRLHEGSLETYFLARYEMTQGQWMRLSGGKNPSEYKAGTANFMVGTVSDAHPVEFVDWYICNELMEHYGLRLPSEEEWEYGCRAGTGSVWFTGNEASTLEGYANTLDKTAKTRAPQWTGTPDTFADGHVIPAPVGSFDANMFGLHDVHGNVAEWCEDMWFYIGGGVNTDSFRVIRGGSFSFSAVASARSSFRYRLMPSQHAGNVGFRAARARH